MISRYLKAPPFEYIETIVRTQLIIVLVLALLTLTLLVFRNWRNRRITALKEEYASMLLTEIMSLVSEGKAETVIKYPGRRSLSRRFALKTVMTEHLGSMSGPERDYLIQRYEELGFAAEDLKAVHSVLWWHRLRAISNLHLLGLDKYGGVFYAHTKDRNQLVASFAYIALSGLKHELNIVRPLQKLPRAVRVRKNVMHEILRNWSRVHGHQFLIEQIQQQDRPDLLTYLIQAVSRVQSPEVAELLTRKLADPSLPQDAAEQILITLRNVGDPDSATAVLACLEHPHEIIRLRAIEYFIAIGDIESLKVSNIYADKSVTVRRVLQDLEGVA